MLWLLWPLLLLGRSPSAAARLLLLLLAGRHGAPCHKS
jgi:hypothetical protein